MVDYTKGNNPNLAGSTGAFVDTGLRAHMIKVYNHMVAGLILSGLVAFAAIKVPAISSIVFTQGGQIGLTLAMLGMVFFVMPKMYTMSENGAKMVFYGYAALLALAMSPIFVMYTGASVARVFFITASVFLSMSLFGYTTKKDLTSWGTFGMMGVWGVFIAAIVNMFMKSDGLTTIISMIAVIASIALTAWDTQKIKRIYYSVSNDTAALNKAAIIGALQLYFDFVYMFINLMNLLGSRR